MSWRNRQKGISEERAIEAINEKGILLVYPLANRPQPESLWSYFFPKTPMRWVWDENGDMRVVRIWDLREKLSRNPKVVYAKWYQNRATFFSKTVFTALLHTLNKSTPSHPELSQPGRQMLTLLVENSPQTTKTLRKRAKSELKLEKKAYEAAMKELWKKLLIVGCGEVDDGAFPSLNVAATELFFEKLWAKAHESPDAHQKLIERFLPVGTPWRKQLEKLKQERAKPKASQKKTVLRYEDLVGRSRKGSSKQPNKKIPNDQNTSEDKLS